MNIFCIKDVISAATWVFPQSWKFGGLFQILTTAWQS